MAAAPNHDAGKQAFGTKLNFIIAIALLVLLALVWSIDISFIYILLGAAAFFLFLGIKNKLNQHPAQEPAFKSYQKAASQKDHIAVFLDDLESFFNKNSGRFRRAKSYTGGDKGQHTARKHSLRAWIFVLSIFGIILMVAIFSSGDDYSSDIVSLNEAGDQFYWSGQYDSAYRSYQRALQINPDNAASWLGIGNVMLAGKNYDSALYYYDKALEKDPAFNQALYGKGLTYYNQQKYAEAINEATAIISKDPMYNDAYLLAGDSYYIQQRYDSALQYYEPAYANGARSQELCYIMAYLYDERGDVEKAVPLYRETLQYDSTIIDIHKRLGELLPGKEGDYYRIKALGR